MGSEMCIRDSIPPAVILLHNIAIGFYGDKCLLRTSVFNALNVEDLAEDIDLKETTSTQFSVMMASNSAI